MFMASFIVKLCHKHVMLCHVMSCYKLLHTFDWIICDFLVPNKSRLGCCALTAL